MTVGISEAEKSWLAAHKDIRLGTDVDYPPFEFLTPDGKYSGISSDYIELLNQRIEIANNRCLMVFCRLAAGVSVDSSGDAPLGKIFVPALPFFRSPVSRAIIFVGEILRQTAARIFDVPKIGRRYRVPARPDLGFPA